MGSAVRHGKKKMGVVVQLLVLLPLLLSVADGEHDSCKLEDFTVQENFDLNRWKGQWYEIQWLPVKHLEESWLYQDYRHIYELNTDDTLTVNIVGRDPGKNLQCFQYENPMTQTDVPGKFRYGPRRFNDTADYTTDYWIISTDYDNYAVAYSCFDRNTTIPEVCAKASTWIWSRRPTLRKPLMDTAWDIVHNLCVNETAFRITQHKNECVQKNNCSVDIFAVQENFDLNRWKGQWYEIQWLPDKYLEESWLYQDYRHIYELNTDDTLTVNVVGRDPGKNLECFDYQIPMTQTDVPGKFRYGPRPFNATANYTTDYWIVSTDYDNYAVAFSCVYRNTTVPEICANALTWIWSRQPTLRKPLMDTAWDVVHNLCVNEADFRITQQKDECPVQKGSSLVHNNLVIIAVFILMCGIAELF